MIRPKAVAPWAALGLDPSMRSHLHSSQLEESNTINKALEEKVKRQHRKLEEVPTAPICTPIPDPLSRVLP